MKKISTIFLLLTSLLGFTQTKTQTIYNYSSVYIKQSDKTSDISTRIFIHHNSVDKNVRMYIGDTRIDYKIERDFIGKTDDGTLYHGYILVDGKEMALLQIFSTEISRFIVHNKNENGGDDISSFELINK